MEYGEITETKQKTTNVDVAKIFEGLEVSQAII